MTVESVRELARRWLNDRVEPYRWDNNAIRRAIGIAVRELNRRVPSTRYVAGELQDGTTVPAQDTEAFDLEDRWEEPLAAYATYLCYLEDSPDTENSELAAGYYTKATAAMV